MKKFIGFMAVLAFIAVPFGVLYADTVAGLEGGSALKWKTIVNNANQINVTSFNTSTEVIPGQTRIVGWEVTPVTNATGYLQLGLYDSSNKTAINASQTGEMFATYGVNTQTTTKWLPVGVTVDTQLTTTLGPYAIATIYYYDHKN